MNTWGYVNSFGTFQAYYTTELSRSPSDVAWIGSFQVFLLFFIGSIVGRLCDAGYVRQLVAIGSVFQLVGIFASSVATKYWQVFLCQGLCVGLGNGLTFCPCISVLPTYFTKKRGIAIGIAFCGTSIGGLVFPTMVRQLLPKIGFGQTVRAIGFIQVGNLVIANLLVKPRLPPRKGGPLVDWVALRDPEYILVVVSATLVILSSCLLSR